MRSCRVVIDPPFFDEAARLGQCCERILVETFVPEPSDEALGKRVLHWFAWGDVMPVDAGFLAPAQDGMTGQFRPVVGDDDLWLAAKGDEPIQFAGNTHA